MSEDIKVLVTGAAGFLATHIVKQLLEAGYKVRGTVRNTKNKNKVEPLYMLSHSAKHELELVEAELTEATGWAEAVRGCSHVLHVASPITEKDPFNVERHVKPAVEGTLNVLRACVEVGSIRRVILTGSALSICDLMSNAEPKDVYTEQDWADPDKTQSAYVRSKILAEKAAWEFVEGLPQESKFEFAVLHPSYLVGPVLCGCTSASMEIPTQMMTRKMPLVPKVKFPTLDVRDAATAHVRALTSSEVVGKRHILNARTFPLLEMAEVVAKEFNPMGYNVPTKGAPDFLLKIYAYFNKQVAFITPTLGKVATLDNKRMTEILDIKPRDPAESIIDMCYSMIDLGFIRKTPNYKARI